jgi:CCR4-NOT complex subunit CAF16
MTRTSMAPSIEVRGLSYTFQDGSTGLKDVVLSLPAGSRTLLIGGNVHPTSICRVVLYSLL